MQGYRSVFPDPYKKAGGEIVQRWRFKRPGHPSATTTAPPGSADFNAWYHALNASTANADPVPPNGRAIALKPGDTGKGKSLDWLCAAYYGAPEFNDLGARERGEGREPSNQRQRRRYLSAFADARTPGGRRFGGSPFEDFTKQDIELYLDKVKAVGRHAGQASRRGGKSVRDSHLAAIRKVFQFAIDRGLTKFRNPTQGIKRRYKGKGNGAWNDDDFAKFRNHWDGINVPRLAFELALAFGFRRSDLHLLGDHMVGADGVLRRTPLKGSESDSLEHEPPTPIEIDLNDYPELRARIRATVKAQAEATGVVNFKGGPWLTNTRGRKFGYGDFGHKWKKWARAAGISEDKVLHGVRAGFAVKMLDVTGNLAAVSDALGHKRLTTTEIYVGGRDKKKSAKGGRLALRDATKAKGVA